jgi:hypothetical protein
MHAHDASGEIINRKQLPLHFEAPAGGEGDLLGVHGIVGPNVATVAYRVYCKVRGELFTDGTLHVGATASV